MTPYDPNRLGTDIPMWMHNRFLQPILSIEGGWEYWLQIDFPAWLDNTYGVQYDFRREVVMRNPLGRIDWLINATLPGGHSEGVQLKAQTHKYLSNAFVTDVLEDYRKVDQWQRGGEISRGAILAAAIDPGAVDQLVRHHGFMILSQYRDLVAFLIRTT